MKLGNDLMKKVKKILLDDIFDDLCSPYKKDIKIFNNKRLEKQIDKTILIAREIYTKE